MVEGDRAVNRRQALSLLATLPLGLRVEAQTRPSARHRVVLGASHGLLLGPDGGLQSWSTNVGAGEQPSAGNVLGLGHNRPIQHFTLYPVSGLSNVVAAAAGSGTSYAVLADGRLMAWGSNAYGLLGTTALSVLEVTAQFGPHSNAPVPVAVPFNAVDVSTQADHVIALARDGSVYTWGKGESGQLGIGPLPVIDFKTRTPSPMSYVPFPVRVPNLADVVAISAGPSHALALLNDGSVRAWGANSMGQVGDGTTADRDRPVAAQGVRNAVAIAAGGRASLAILSDGSVMAWGSQDNSLKPRPVPTVVTGARRIRSVAAGGGHAVAITEIGEVMTWGVNEVYDLGRGRDATSVPALVKGITDAQSVAARERTSVVVLASGRIMTWGVVREWTRPEPVMSPTASPFPILLWLDGLEQP
jgi:alpha-tubulin suppressor-like RCC1 family protein